MLPSTAVYLEESQSPHGEPGSPLLGHPARLVTATNQESKAWGPPFPGGAAKPFDPP